MSRLSQRATLEAKAQASPSPLNVLQDATKSKAAFTLFVLNPQNSWFCGLAAVALIATLYVAVHAVFKVTFSWQVGSRTEFCVFLLIGLWGGTVSTLFQVTIQESINRFRALNSRLDKEIQVLSQEVDGLGETSEQLTKQLEAFEDLRTQMQAYAEEAGVEFGDLLKKATGVFGSMKDVQQQREFALLRKVAADIEFMDDKEGMTFQEFKRFCMRAPLQYREKLKQDQEETFKDVAGDDDLISFEELQKFFTKLVEECKPAAEGNAAAEP